MLKANASDSKKLLAVIETILTTAGALHDELRKAVCETLPLRFISVDPNQFYDQCRFARLRKSDFAAEVNDVMSSTNFHTKFGAWLYVEYEHNRWLFVYVGGRSDRNFLKHMVDCGEMVEIVVPEVVQTPTEEKGIWYITISGTVLKLGKKTPYSLSGDGAFVTLNYNKYGTYTTKTYPSKAQAENALIALNDDEDEDDWT